MIVSKCDKCGKIANLKWHDSGSPLLPEGWEYMNSINYSNIRDYKYICNTCCKNSKMKKIYVASSWRNEYHGNIVYRLRISGHEVYDFKNTESAFHFSKIDPNWKKWKPEEFIRNINNPICEKGFQSDFNAMKWADVCILLLPSGRSAHTEAGWMKGNRKKVYVLMIDKEEPELMYKIYDNIFCKLNDLLEELLK